MAVCRQCHSRLSTVVDSKSHTVTFHGKRKNAVHQTHRCQHCGHTFTTVARHAIEDPPPPSAAEDPAEDTTPPNPYL